MKMVFKILSNASGFPAVNYNEHKQGKEKGFLTYIQNFHTLTQEDLKNIPGKDLRDYLQRYSARNTRIKNPQFHAILSCQGKNYTFDELTKVARELMNQMGYKDNPLLIYGHQDTPNRHVHIVSSRVGPEGKKIAHAYERVQAMKILNQLLDNNVDQQLAKDIKGMYKWDCQTKAAYFLVLEKLGYHIQQNSDGKFWVAKFGSVIGEIPEEEIKKVIQLSGNEVARARSKMSVQEKIRKATTLDASLFKLYIDPQTKSYTCKLANMLQRQGIHFVFFSKENKLPYGYSIIDFNSKRVFKGSEILNLSKFLNPQQNPVNTKELRHVEIAANHLSSYNREHNNFNSSFGNYNSDLDQPSVHINQTEGMEAFFETAIQNILEEALYTNETIQATRKSKKKKYKKLEI